MKRLYIFLLALVGILSVHAQTQDNAMYVYRNDGSFNAFLREDVDSILLSNFDNDSIYHEEFVSQVFYTPDSIYRISIAAIDSVSFVQPETKLATGVKIINDWMEYFSHVDEDRLAISFQPTLPYDVNVGDVLLFTDIENEILPDGFAGRICSIEKRDITTYVCDSVGIDDIFENLVVIGKLSAKELNNESKTLRSDAPRKVNIEGGIEKPINIPFGLNEEEGKYKLSLGGNALTTIKVTVVLKKVLGQPLYANFQVGGKIGLSLKALLEAEGTMQRPKEENFKKYLSKAFINVPIPYTLNAVRLKVRLAPLCRITGKAYIEAEAHADIDTFIGVEHENGETHFTNGCNASAGYSASFGLEGDLFAGVRFFPYLSGVGGFFTLGLKMDAGAKWHGQFLLQSKVNNTNGKLELPDGLFDSLKDSKAELKAGATLSAEVNFKFLKKEFRKLSGELDLFWPISENYLLPEFSKPKIQELHSEHSALVTSIPSRDLLMPVQLGIGLVDSEGKLIESQYKSEFYRKEKDWSSNALWAKFDNLNKEEEYKVMPYVSVLGMKMKASPSSDFKDEPSSCSDENHPHQVDLGLPSGTMWACTNLYAEVPEDTGWFFAWAETTPKYHYTPDWYAGYGADFPDIAGMRIDAATANWGPDWRMPTQTQMQELMDECTWQWTTQNGKTGYLITGPNENTIFMPGGGMMYDTIVLIESLGNGYYWTSTPGGGKDDAYGLNFDSGKRVCKKYGRYGGRTIRPVYYKEPENPQE